MAKNEAIKEKSIVTGEMVAEVLQVTQLKFSKSQLVKSQKYNHRRDALNALLNDGRTYSFTEVDAVLKKFDEGVKK